MYEFHNMLPYIIFFFYSFWIPQIVSNVIRDTRKPLHVHYILGITATRLAVPLYIFGCPKNFMRIEVDMQWCTSTFLLLPLGFPPWPKIFTTSAPPNHTSPGICQEGERGEIFSHGGQPSP